MSEEIRKVIEIETSEGEKSIKQLRKEIASLKDSLLNLDKGSEEYTKALDGIARRQSELNTVMNTTRNLVEAEKGSYSALVQEMAMLKQQFKTTGDEAKRNEIGTRIKEINDELKRLDEMQGNYSRNVGNYANGVADGLQKYRERIKELKGELIGLQQGTEEYNNKVAELGTLQRKFNDITEISRYRANDLGQQISLVTGTLKGVVAGFSAVNGIMGLFGSKNEDLQKAMLKTQQMMQIVQGLSGVEGLTKKLPALISMIKGATAGTKGFIAGLSGVKKAIMGTGIGLLVVGLGELIAHWDELSRLLGVNKSKADEMKEANDRLTQSIKDMNEASDYQARLAKAMGVSEEEIYQMKLKNLNAQKDEIRNELLKYEIKNANRKLNKEEKEQLEELRKKYDDVSASIKKLNQDEAIRQAEKARKAEEDAAKAAADAYKKSVEEKKKAYEDFLKKTMADTEATLDLSTVKDGFDDYIKELEKDFNSVINGLEANAKNVEKTYKELVKGITDSFKEDDFKENTLIGEWIDEEAMAQAKESIAKRLEELARLRVESVQRTNEAELASYEDAYENGLITYDAYLSKKNELEKNYTDAYNAYVASRTKTEQAAQKVSEVADAQRKKRTDALTTATLNFGNALSSLFKQESENESNSKKEREEYLKAYKATAIASTVASTAEGIMSAIAQAQSLGPIAGPIAAAVQSAAILASGVASVSSIQNEKLNSSSTTTQTSTQQTGASVVAPSIYQSSPITQVRNVITDTEAEEQSRDNKVYLVYTELEEYKNKVDIRESNSLF